MKFYTLAYQKYVDAINTRFEVWADIPTAPETVIVRPFVVTQPYEHEQLQTPLILSTYEDAEDYMQLIVTQMREQRGIK